MNGNTFSFKTPKPSATMYIDFDIRSDKADLSALNAIIALDSEFFRIDSIKYIKRGSKLERAPTVVYELNDGGEIIKAIPQSEFTGYDHWSFETKEYTDFVLVDSFISAFRQSLGDNFFRIREFIRNNEDNALECHLCVVIKNADHNDFPAISISLDNMNFLHELNADIDFDICFYS
ncbi:MAG: DUF4279 domain-containing protein [Treponemataceae bacterium]|nr:DUF4279 domain-containing protein [Treponemataceae bacterium]